MIVLSLSLTALGAVVMLTQQYDLYEQTVNRMTQYRNQGWSEDLVAVNPGLAIVNSTVSGWGSGCDGSGVNTYNCYVATMSNLGAVGVQITRIYINSTGLNGLGCSSPNPQPCILNPTSAIGSYAFNEANGYVNPDEVNHHVTLALPIGVALPDPNPAFPQNTITIVTSRGNVFIFQWPLQATVFGQSQSAFSSGNMKVAYTGTYDSKNEPLNGGTQANGYCHTEATEAYPAPAGYAEKLTGITGYGDSGVLQFVNPWITSTILENDVNGGSTYFYIYVVIVNTGLTAYTPTAGSLDITWYGSNHLDGWLIGVFYNGGFYATAPSIPPGAYYYAIYQITPSWVKVGNPPTTSVMWWGGASITNGSNSNAEGQTYFSGTILVSGLWIRYEATAGSCA
jgi:hypothetical protein